MTRTTFIYLLSLIFLSSCGNTDKKIEHAKTKSIPQPELIKKRLAENLKNWEFIKVKNDELRFKEGNFYKTDLFDLEYIGQIKVDRKAPFLIFSGRDCDGCDENINIYINSPSDGKLRVENGQNRYQFPGSETDFESDSLFYTSRAFFGEILEKKYGVIWYENNLMENGKMGKSTFITFIENGVLRDTIFADHKDLNETIKLFNKGFCKEIKGMTYRSEP